MEIINRTLQNGQLATFFFDKEGFICVQVGNTQYEEPFFNNPLEIELSSLMGDVKQEAHKRYRGGENG